MSDYNILFYLYLGIVSLLLFIFAMFVSLQLRFLTFYLLAFFKILNVSKSSFVFSFKDYQKFYHFYLTTADYFLSISLSELYLEDVSDLDSKKNIYVLLALAYRELSFIEIAKYYYLKALSLDPNNVQLSESLRQMYSQLGYRKDDRSLYRNSIK